MRHLLAALACTGILLGAASEIDAVAARSDTSGSVWVVVRGPVGPGLQQLVEHGDLRVVNTWAAGRLVQLHAAKLRDVALPAASAWAGLRLPQESLAWPGCG